jgi:hypothetical protein
VRTRDQTTIDEVHPGPSRSQSMMIAGPARFLLTGSAITSPRSDDGFDFQAICILQKEPTSEKSQRIENTVFEKSKCL